jgi:NAD+ kinase
MKIHIFGRGVEKIAELKSCLKDFHIEYSEDNPDLVICYGGDGTFLIAERVFPGVPKIFLKGSEISLKGSDIEIRKALELYIKGSYEIEEIKKLKATQKGLLETRELVGVNDIVIRNSLPTEAVRFKLKINGNEIQETLLGDGIVVSTPYGSGGYFSSITHKDFKKGIGLAFNNLTTSRKEEILKENGEIEVEIIRGPAVLVADNNRDYVNMENGDKIYIKQINEIARRVVFKDAD